MFSQKQLDALPADLRQIVLDTAIGGSECADQAHPQRGRCGLRSHQGQDDADRPPADQRAKRDTRQAGAQQARQGTFAPELIAKLEQLGQ